MNKCTKTYTGKHNWDVVKEHIDTIQIGDDITSEHIPEYTRCIYCGVIDDRKKHE